MLFRIGVSGSQGLLTDPQRAEIAFVHLHDELGFAARRQYHQCLAWLNNVAALDIARDQRAVAWRYDGAIIQPRHGDAQIGFGLFQRCDGQLIIAAAGAVAALLLLRSAPLAFRLFVAALRFVLLRLLVFVFVL